MSQRNDDVVRGQASEPDATDTPADGGGWLRPPFLRTLLIALIPLGVLLVINLTLLTVVRFTSDAVYERIAPAYRLVDFNREDSVPTWLNASLWVLSGAVAGYIARRATRYRKSWWLFAAVCVYLSIDEAIGLHEMLEPLGESLNLGLAYAWVIPGVIIAAFVVLMLARMVFSLPPVSRNGLLIGGVAFIIGSIGVETFAGFVQATPGGGGLYALLGNVEEGLEIFGVSLCLVSLLYLLRRRRLDGATEYRLDTTRS